VVVQVNHVTASAAAGNLGMPEMITKIRMTLTNAMIEQTMPSAK
jgi:hypothetical protein